MSNPSLLCVPYRFKTSRLYSQIPDSGLGDFNVTRSASNVATRVNAAGLIERVNDNIPRLDYPLGGITAGCPALLVEPSATNFLVRSEEFDNANWGKNATGINTSIGTNGIQANVAISPDGTQNADRVNFNLQADLDVGLTQNYAAATVGQVYNTSIYFKGEGTNIGKQIKVRIKRISGGSFVGSDATITLTSDWVRFASSAITLVASNSGVQVIVSSNDATNALIWGAQLEQGSVATSYIPTTTAAITRGAETVSKTGVSSLIGQTEGTIYAEFNMQTLGVEGYAIRLVAASFDNSVHIVRSSANLVSLVVRAGGSNVFSQAVAATGFVKAAVAYKSGDIAAFVNGTQVGTTSTSSLTFGASFTAVNLGAFSSGAAVLNDRIRAAALYTTRLPNTGPLSLQSLTQ